MRSRRAVAVLAVLLAATAFIGLGAVPTAAQTSDQIILTATDQIVNGTDAPYLENSVGVSTFTIGTSTYAAVAAFNGDGVQILDVTDPANVISRGNIGDNTALELDGAWGIDTFVREGRTYAAVTGQTDDGVQILDVTDPANIISKGSIANSANLELNGPRGITIFESDGLPYAAVAGYSDSGVQILNLTDPDSPKADGTNSRVIHSAPDVLLSRPYYIATFERSDSTYAIATSENSDAVQIINLDDPANPTAAGNIHDNSTGTPSDYYLDGARGIATFESDGLPYAAVTAYTDHGVQILNLTDPANPTAAGNIGDTTDILLQSPWDIDVFEFSGSTYAAVTSVVNHGVQILDITDPDNPTPVGSIGDNADRVLDSPAGIDTFTINGDIYATVAGWSDDAVQIIRLTEIDTDDDTEDTTSFITTWQTTGANQTVIIPGTGTYTVDWGDGSTPTSESGTATHEYAAADTYTVSISGDLERIYLGDTASNDVNDDKLQSIEQWGDIAWTDMSWAFLGAANMVYNATDAPDLSDVTDMSSMFRLARAFDGDLSGWDTSNVEDMDNMFNGASSFNGDLSGWDTSKVTDMAGMFREARVFNGNITGWDTSKVTNMVDMFFNVRTFEQDLFSWDVSNVTLMNGMFTNAYAFNGNITGWDTSKVTNMAGMFSDARTFDQDLSSWDVSNVTLMGRMFLGATSFNGNISGWDVSGVTDMGSMFNSATVFNGNISGWDVSGVTLMDSMFLGATSFNGNISDWDVSGVTNMGSMFLGATVFNQDISDWNVSSVTNMAAMFFDADAFDQNLGKWYVVPDSTSIVRSAVPGIVGNITAQNTVLDDHHSHPYGKGDSADSDHFVISGNSINMTSTDTGQTSYKLNVTASGGDVFGSDNWNLITITVTGEDAEDTTSFITTWQTTTANESITFPGTGTYTVDWGDGSTPTSESGTATHEYAAAGTYTVSVSGDLERIHLGSSASNDDNDERLRSIEQWGNMEWDNMSGAFWGASNMVYNATDAPDLSGVTDMSSMFNGATAFDGDLSSWDVSGVTNMANMFFSATTFDGDISGWDVSGVDVMGDMFNGATTFDGDLSGWDVSGVVNTASMFNDATAFDGDLSGWDVSGVTLMSNMFNGATLFNRDISGWDVSSVIQMGGMFNGATLFNRDISGWDVSSVIQMGGMFNGATSFQQNLGKWYVVPDNTLIARSAIPGIVGDISAQNGVLDGHSPVYGIGDSDDSDHFTISGNRISMVSSDTGQTSYALTVTASGSSVFENGRNSHAFTVTVTDRPSSLPPIFISSALDSDTGTLEITFSEAMDVTPATNVVLAKIHIRESGNYTGGVNLNATELDSTADGATISFTLTAEQLTAVADLDVPELTIEPGAVRDVSGSLIESSFDASTAVTAGSASVSGQDNLPRGIALSANGTKMFIVGGENYAVSEYAMSTPFDISNLTHADSTSIAFNTTTPQDLAFSDDGTKMFVLESSGRRIHEYALSTPFDASTLTYNDSTYVSSQERQPRGMAFSNDGAKMFVTGWDGDDINEYTLSTAFDVSTLAHVDATSISDEENNPTGMAFSNDGTKMFVVGGSGGGQINAYDLSAPFDTSTLAHIYTASVQGARLPEGVAFSNDGTKMFVVDSPNEKVFQYTLSSVYPIMLSSVQDPPADATSFVTTWQTTSTGESVTFPGTGTYTINWGDGTTDTDVTGPQTHEYASAGTYTVSVSGGLTAVTLGDSTSNAAKLQSIDQWGDIGWTTMNRAFQDASFMTYRATDAPDLSQVTDMRLMFDDAYIFNGNLSSWDTSGVTDMSYMFWIAREFNGDLSGWDVSSVTNMTGMFNGASAFNQPLSSWDTSSVTVMDSMFAGASLFNQPLSLWDTSSVIDMNYMFSGASLFNQTLSSWDTSSVTRMDSMFRSASAFNQPLSSWDVSGVTDMNYMFSGASLFNQPLSSWDTSSVTDMSRMFRLATEFNYDLSGWDVSSVTDMTSMFNGASAFNQPLSSWGTSSVTRMSSMFSGASLFNQPLSSWDTSSVTDMSYMFNGASLFNQPLSSWDTSSVTDMDGMFNAASLFNQPLSSWDTSSVTDMSYMFYDASAFNGDISGWDVSGVTAPENMDEMFFNAGAFDQNLGKWYIVASSTSIASTPGTVGEISAQNSILDDHSPTYEIGTGGDSTRFAIHDGDKLNMTSAVPGQDSYTVNVTASGSSVFEDGNNWDLITITVTDDDDDTEDTTSFITTWQTTTTDKSIIFPGTGTYTVDWGDGSTPTSESGTATHEYDDAGTYTVSVSGDLERIHLGSSASNDANDAKLRSIEQWGDIEWSSMNEAFRGASNMVYNADDAPDLSGVTDMTHMFRSASSFDGDLSEWDVSKVTIMHGMFHDASSFDGDLSRWNTSGVTSMVSIFRDAIDFNSDISDWDISGVTNMADMFYGASSFNGDISRWDTSGVVDMTRLFRDATAFNSDISGWDTSSVDEMLQLFRGASAFNSDISGWDISQVGMDFGSMSRMFDGATAFQQNLGEWYVVVNSTSIVRSEVPGTVGEISAQNSILDGHSPTYEIGTGGDSTRFAMHDGDKLNMTSVVSGQDSYTVNVTASGGSVFEDGNNWRVLNIIVGVSTNNAPVAEAGPDLSVDEGGSVRLQGSGSDDDAGDTLTYSWSDDFRLTFDDSTSATPTVTASSVTADTSITLTLTVSDGTASTEDTMTLTIRDVTPDNLRPTVSVGPNQTVREGAAVSMPWTAVDPDGDTLTYLWSQDPATPAIFLGSERFSPTTFIAPQVDADTVFTLTLQVTAGPHIVQDSLTVTVKNNRPPAVDAGQNRTFNEGAPVTLRGTANDPDGDPLTYEWRRDSGPAPADLTGSNTTSLQFTAPGVASDREIVFRFAATDDAGESAEDTVTITVRDVPITVSSAAYNPGNGQLVITFNQDIDTVNYSGLHVRSSANLDTGGITLSSVTDRSDLGRTITATLDSDQQDQYDALQSPHLVVETGAVTDTDGDRILDASKPIRDASQKKSSSSKAPLVNMIALAQARILDIPPHIAKQVVSHDDSDPLEPIIPDGTFDLPLVINGYGYLLDDTTNTLVPQTVTAGDNSTVHITFTVYTQNDLAHFTLYLNLQDGNTGYADSDTYIEYGGDGTTGITDPHGYIADATITVTQEDDQMPEKRTVRVTVEFGEEPMGPTNMVAYTWNTDRKAVFVNVIDALVVAAASPEPAMQAADPEPVEPDSELPADPEPLTPDLADDAADPEHVSPDALWPDDYDEAHVLTLIRMWSGFESEMITDAQLIEFLGLDGYLGTDLPDWMMTDLGVLAAKGDVTVDEFMLALQYVLEHA